MKRSTVIMITTIIVLTLLVSFSSCTPSAPAQTESEQTTEEQTAEEQTTEEQTASEQAGVGTEINVLSHRFPATEHYVNKMSALEDVVISATLMPHDKIMQIARINLAADRGAYDILFTDDFQLREYAIQGFLEPLDSYVEEYQEKYNLTEIPQSLWDNSSYDGHIYNIPFGINLQILFYRPDILEQYNVEVPTTTDEYLAAAKLITEESNGEIYGAGMTMKPGDGMINEFTSYLHAFGGDWYNDDLTPAFNSEAGLNALNYMIELYQYAPKESISWGNDEALIAVQSGNIAMINQWNTRAASTDDPERSEIVGMMQYAPSVVVPGIDIPASRIAAWGYSIPANSPADKDLIFSVLCEVSDYEGQVEAVDLANPTRTAIAEKETELFEEDKYRHLPAAFATAAGGAKGISYNPLFIILADEITTYLGQAVTGEISAEEALEKAEMGAIKRLEEEGLIQ